MSKQSPTVLEFIMNGKTTGTATSVEFEGFAVRGDEGNGLRFFKTSAQDTASQTPIQRGNNSFTDVNGYVYELNDGSVIYFNGSNSWFPQLGSSGPGTYTSSPTGWNQASVSATDPYNYNIKEKGAAGDGVQDDTSYISPAHSNFLPEGIYNIDTEAVNLQNLYGSGLISHKQAFGTNLPNALGDLSSKRVIHEFDIRFPSYDQALALSSGASYLFPQSLEIFENTIYVVYGAGGGSNAEMWVVAYSANDFTELSVFKVSDRFGEGLAIYKDGANTFMMCRYNNAGVDKVGKFNLTTLPTTLTTLAPIATYDVDVSSFVTTDGSYIYVQEKNLQGGLVKRNKIGTYKKDMTFVCYKFFDEKDFGTISANSTQPKAQNFCAYKGNFLATYGSTHELGDPVSTSLQVGIKEFSSSCSQSDGFMLNGDAAITILRAKGYDVDLIEYEGICEYNGIPISLLVTKSHTHTGSGGLLLLEEKSPVGIPFVNARSLMGSETSNYSGSERVAQSNDGIVNPLDSSLFSSTIQIMNWMYKSGTSVFSFYTSGSSISDVNGVSIGSGRFVKIKTGNFSSFDMKIESSTTEEDYWITRASESNYTQTKKPTQSGGDEAISWDFEYVANDSLRLRSGYGNANNELDFSRASPSDYINKSKFLSSKLQDNELITECGISLYAGFTNRLNYQSDLSNSVWTKVGCLITKDATGSLFNDGNANSEHFARQIDSGATYSNGLSVKVRVKDVSGNLSVRVRIGDDSNFIGAAFFNFSTESFYSVSANLDVKYEKLADGSFYLNVKSNTPTSTSPQIAIYSVLEGTTNTLYPGAGRSFYVMNTQMANSTSFLAISQVADTQVARNEDILSFKSMNNVPSLFSSLTIEIGTSVPVSSGDYQNLLRADVLSNYFWMRREDNSEDIRLYSPPGTLNFGTINDAKHRFTITFDGSAIKSFVDGVLINTISSSVSPLSTLDYSGNIHIGGSPFGGQNLNSEVKYFRIKHSALTDEQVSARGGY